MALTDKLTDIADAIRAKTGDNGLLSLTDMPIAIASITGGSGIELPNDFFDFSDQINDYLLANNRMQYLVENYPQRFDFSNTRSASYFLADTKYTIPNTLGAITLRTVGNTPKLDHFCCGAKVSYIPQISGDCYGDFQQFFAYSSGTLPRSNIFNNLSLQTAGQFSNFLSSSFLRGTLSLSFANRPYSTSKYMYNWVIAERYQGDTWYGLDGLTDIFVTDYTGSGNPNTITMTVYAPMLKHYTFAKNNGTVYTAKYHPLTLDMSQTGYWYNQSDDGINSNNVKVLFGDVNMDLYIQEAQALRITDATTYTSLKNNPNAWTSKYEYSFYNKTAALETIDSLPDVSSYGTATIKFKGDAGSGTDGGAINTMTAAEIAVATAKGWTVTFV